MEIFIDLETIPGPTRPSVDDISAPANYKDPEKIRAYQEANVEDAYRKQALDSMVGRIWCIGVAHGDGPAAAYCGEEEELLLSLNRDIAVLEEQADFDHVWIGHNAQAFDLKWLWRRAKKYQLKNLTKAINLDRYKGNVKDTMLMWACGDPRDYVKLDTLAQFLGVGAKTPGMDGSKVHDLWLAGDTKACEEYCKRDVELTRAVYRRLKEV